MNALRTIVKDRGIHKPTTETYKKFSELLKNLMAQAPLDKIEMIFTLKERLDKAIMERNSPALSQLDYDIQTLRSSL